MKDQEECEKAYIANGIPEDSDETDSEDDTAYRNNTDDSVFLAKKIIRYLKLMTTHFWQPALPIIGDKKFKDLWKIL